MKRYCQTLDLYNEPQLIADYVQAHQHVWPEIKKGICEVGIIDMEIYIHENRLFMIVETNDEFDWERDMERLSKLPYQKEWETYMSKFQVSKSAQSSHEKWHLMKQIFKLK